MQSYDGLFTQSAGLTAESNFGQKWGWYQSIYALANGDITRFEDITQLELHECLYALEFKKEKNELEAKRIKNG